MMMCRVIQTFFLLFEIYILELVFNIFTKKSNKLADDTPSPMATPATLKRATPSKFPKIIAAVLLHVK